MKKTLNIKKIGFLAKAFLCLCLFLFNSSCGLEVLNEPIDNAVSDLITIPYLDSTGLYEVEFSFNIKEQSTHYDDLRTYIYYKIYNSKSKFENEVENLKNMAGDSVNKDKSANRLRDNDSNGYNYKLLGSSEAPGGISFSNGNHKVKIRLVKYDNDFKNRIEIDGNEHGVPVRYSGTNKDFNFSTANDNVPKSTDEDSLIVDNQSEDDKDKFYVALFALTEGRDNNFMYYYSPVKYLGGITIQAENN